MNIVDSPETKTLSINVFEISIADIKERYTRKKNSIITLQQSIDAIGLQAPISVIQSGNKYLILDGNRRFAACKNLGHEKIRCIVHMF